MTAHSGPSVLLATEGTYPYHRGGVSTWCDALTTKLAEVDFTLLAVTMHPYLDAQYRLAPNVREMITVPLWGTEDPAEYGRHATFADYFRRRSSTTTRALEEGYLPVYERLLREIVDPVLPPRSLGLVLLRLHQHLRHYDYDRTQKHPAVWESFVAIVDRAWRDAHPDDAPPTLAEVTEAWRLLYRLMLPLSVEIPRVDIAHSAAAAFCGLPCIMQKVLWGTPYLLTEHGVYLREQYLNLGRQTKSLFVRWFLTRLVSTITNLNYAFADQVSPVCQYNTRWERWHDVDVSRIRVIYNGVDPVAFSPGWRRPNARPTVVCMGQIFPLKGQRSLIEAAALVRQVVPDVEFLFYGSASDDAYFRECELSVATHGLEDHVSFKGLTNEPWAVMRRADLVASSSTSEAFPYAIVEAMLTGSAIAATDVGGVREALGATGLLVPPNDPVAMAEAIALLLKWPDGRERLGHKARDRALQRFTEDRFIDAYRASYARLMTPAGVELEELEPAAEPQFVPAAAIA
jgi:glycosyltransferase involved in cell wall biosynthesis